MANSLDIIGAEARSERDAQLRHFESLDAKAGFAIGFAGLLVTFGTGSSTMWIAGRCAAVLAVLLAVWAALPRRFPMLDLHHLRESYERADPAFTQRFLVDTIVAFVTYGAELLERKALRLRLALAALSASVVLEGVAILLR